MEPMKPISDDTKQIISQQEIEQEIYIGFFEEEQEIEQEIYEDGQADGASGGSFDGLPLPGDSSTPPPIR